MSEPIEMNGTESTARVDHIITIESPCGIEPLNITTIRTLTTSSSSWTIMMRGKSDFGSFNHHSSSSSLPYLDYCSMDSHLPMPHNRLSDVMDTYHIRYHHHRHPQYHHQRQLQTYTIHNHQNIIGNRIVWHEPMIQPPPQPQPMMVMNMFAIVR